MAKRKPSADEILKALAIEKLKRPPRPKSGEIAAAVINRMGGPDAFADEFHQNYAAAERGSLVRQRMLGQIMGLLKIDDDVSEDALDELGDEDLKQVLGDSLADVLKRLYPDASGPSDRPAVPAGLRPEPADASPEGPPEDDRGDPAGPPAGDADGPAGPAPAAAGPGTGTGR